jgi:hypothetical protein
VTIWRSCPGLAQVGQGAPELAALLDVVDGQVEQLLGAAHRPGSQSDAAVVEDLHGDPEACPGSPRTFGRHLDVVEAEPAEVVDLHPIVS